MIIKPVAHYEIPQLVEQFSKFTGIKFTDLAPRHPLRIYYEEYDKWWKDEFQKPAGDLDAISAQIIDFAGILNAVRLGQHLIGKIKKEFVADIRDENNCHGVFFELRMLVHLFHLECGKLIENLSYREVLINEKKPDFVFTKRGSFRRILLEGTRKHAREERRLDDARLIEDLIRSLKEKAESYQVLEYPLIYAVHVPEDVQLNRESFRIELGRRLQETFKDKIYRNVNCAVFSGYRIPLPTSHKAKGIVVFDSDLLNLSYLNGSVDPSLDEKVIRLFNAYLGVPLNPSGIIPIRYF